MDKKIKSIAVAICLLTSFLPNGFCGFLGEGFRKKIVAEDVRLDTSGFSGNLSSADSDVQAMAETVDALAAGSGDVSAVGDCATGACFGGASGTTLTFKGSSSGTTTLAPAAAASGALTLPAATDTLVGRDTTDTLTNKTLTAPQISTIELGNASDTTIARSGAGAVTVEGVVIPSVSSTDTLTNKRVTPRVGTVTDAATITPTGDSSDMYTVTALAQAATIAAPSGTPTNGQRLIIRFLDNATGRALTWNAIYRAVGITLPTTTTASKTLYVGFIYNSADSKWDGVATVVQA